MALLERLGTAGFPVHDFPTLPPSPLCLKKNGLSLAAPSFVVVTEGKTALSLWPFPPFLLAYLLASFPAV